MSDSMESAESDDAEDQSSGFSLDFWNNNTDAAFADDNMNCSFLFSTLRDQYILKKYITLVQVLPAVLLIIFFAFTAQRSRRSCRRPAVPVPLQLHSQRDNRGQLCAAFGIAVWSIMQVIFSGKSLYEWGYRSEIHAARMMVDCVLLGVIYWPVMAAINCTDLAGQVLGCVYIWWCAVCAVLISVPCKFTPTDTLLVAIEMLPLYLFLVYVCVSMPLRIWLGVRQRRQKRRCSVPATNNNTRDHWCSYAFRHVRMTLRKNNEIVDLKRQPRTPPNVQVTIDQEKKYAKREVIERKTDNNDRNGSAVQDEMEQKPDEEKTREEKDLDVVDERDRRILNARFYRVLPGFRYSLNVLAAVTVTHTAVFLLAVSGFRYREVLYEAATRFVHAFSLAISAAPVFLTGNRSATVVDVVEVLDEESRIREYARGPIFVSVIAAYLLNVVAMLLLLRNYRRHLVYLYHGQHIQIPEYNKTKAPTVIMAHSAKFIGFQLGYGIYAYLVHTFWFSLILGAIWTNVILVTVYGHIKVAKKIGKLLILALGYLTFMHVVQLLLAHFVFCQKVDESNGKKESGRWRRRVLALDNRHLYMNYQYFMVFFNAPLGILNAFGRVIKMLVFSLWTMPRCDIPSLSSGFEFFDSAFRTYTCMLTVENAISNPILVVFVHLLVDAIHLTTASANGGENVEAGVVELYVMGDGRSEVKRSPRPPRSSSRKRARTRWHLLYTLYHNPLLRAYRSHATAARIPMLLTLSRLPGTFEFRLAKCPMKSVGGDERHVDAVPESDSRRSANVLVNIGS